MASALSLPIETERLCLREFCRSDADALHAYASQEEVTRYLMWGPNDRQASETQLSSFIEAAAAQPRTVYELALSLRADGRVIGALCLYLDDASDQEPTGAELGFVLHSDFWGQGMATEAAKALLSHGRSELDLAHVWATCDARNQGSIGVLEKIGMFRQETVRGARVTEDGHIDEHRYVFPAA
ncbi:MAG: GNAT family N-acetyltransferase [Rhodobiaceae bacterium]|nr:GNAT family N-acetyltransferase [Rhodobiaceae bacterium]